LNNMAKFKLNINGMEVTGYPGQTILEVANENGIDIPTLCYDERVKIYGACGLCVVEIEGSPKLARACATEIRDGMVIKTDTERTRGSRKIALELLLSDHTGDCRPPCTLACPAQTDCQGYVGLIANGKYRESLELIKEQLPLPASIGRVCPHPCEDACRRHLVDEPVSIAWLKRLVGDIDIQSGDKFIPELATPTGKSVAIIGAGPAGLTAAYFLAKAGHRTVIFEAMPQPGGMLKYGIPQYRLPNEVLDEEIDTIKSMGVEIRTGIKVGRDVSLSHLRNNYDAVFIAIGAWKSISLNCPGDEVEGVLGGIDFLRDVTLNKKVTIGKKVAVIGGGNTAMDACRTAIRLGAEKVSLIYRRSRSEMPAEEIEIIEAEEEGVEFNFLHSPLEIISDNGKATGLRLQKMELGEADASGRRRPIPIPGSESILEVDTVIQAIGQGVVADGMDDIELTKYGTIAADPNSFSTNIPGIFAGGDAINDGPGIAIAAIGHARKASDVICSYLNGETIPYEAPYLVKQTDLTEEDFADKPKIPRSNMPQMTAEERKDNFNEIVYGYASEEEAIKDAARCLECGCGDFFECKLIDLANKYGVEPERLAGEMHHRKVENNHPFIVREPDKCILCGLCIRVCDEVMGIGALGLVDRGFDTIAQPEFDLPLNQTGCISCGQCVSVCPTGALQERLTIDKPVPLKTTDKKSVCSFCSVGCNLNLKVDGELLVKSVPDKESKVDNGLLCVKGRFGADIAQKEQRILSPLVRKNGELVEVDWNEALLTVAKGTQSIISGYGSDSVALSISDRYTNEEIFAAIKLGRDVLGTENIFSFNGFGGGIRDVLGYDASTNSFDELLSTEVIVVVGSDLMKNHPIVGLKVKKATENGAKLIVINPFASQIDEWAYKKVCPENNTIFIKGIIKALIDNGAVASDLNTVGFAELKESLSEITTDADAIEIANLYGKAKKAMIVFDQSNITVAGAHLLADMAVISGHIGKPRSGIIQLKPKANSQGLSDLGVGNGPASVMNAVSAGTVKGMIILGEDPKGSDFDATELAKLDFLVVQDTHLTETALAADVVLPGVSFVESSGSFTSSERRIQFLEQAIPALTNMDNYDVIVSIIESFVNESDFCCPECTFEDIVRTVEEYKGVDPEQDNLCFWPVDARVLYSSAFGFEDGKARLITVADVPLFEQKADADNLENVFVKFLKENELIKK
jgi:formate dehydrogenase major subunit